MEKGTGIFGSINPVNPATGKASKHIKWGKDCPDCGSKLKKTSNPVNCPQCGLTCVRHT